MELTRRDALAALTAAGVAGGGALALSAANRDSEDGDEEPQGPIDDDTLATLTATAEVLYPSEVEGVESFVEKFVRGRVRDRPDHAAGIADAVDYLEEWTGSWYDDGFTALDASTRDAALERLGVDEADPDPAGTDRERIRYYVVNELLFALYASPTGGELVGIENPQGHPGGTESYQRGPRER